MATREGGAVNFEFVSVEECEAELKSHKASFRCLVDSTIDL